MVREAEEMAGALTGLDVLKRHIIYALAARIRMIQVAQHLFAAWANINFTGLTADSRHQGVSIGQRARTRGKARQSVGLNISARIVEEIHGASRDNEGLSRIQ